MLCVTKHWTWRYKVGELESENRDGERVTKKASEEISSSLAGVLLGEVAVELECFASVQSFTFC